MRIIAIVSVAAAVFLKNSNAVPVFNNQNNGYYEFNVAPVYQSPMRHPDQIFANSYTFDHASGQLIACSISRHAFPQIEPPHQYNPYPTILCLNGGRAPFDHIISIDGVTTVYGFPNAAGVQPVLATYYAPLPQYMGWINNEPWFQNDHCHPGYNDMSGPQFNNVANEFQNGASNKFYDDNADFLSNVQPNINAETSVIGTSESFTEPEYQSDKMERTGNGVSEFIETSDADEILKSREEVVNDTDNEDHIDITFGSFADATYDFADDINDNLTKEYLEPDENTDVTAELVEDEMTAHIQQDEIVSDGDDKITLIIIDANEIDITDPTTTDEPVVLEELNNDTSFILEAQEHELSEPASLGLQSPPAPIIKGKSKSKRKKKITKAAKIIANSVDNDDKLLAAAILRSHEERTKLTVNSETIQPVIDAYLKPYGNNPFIKLLRDILERGIHQKSELPKLIHQFAESPAVNSQMLRDIYTALELPMPDEIKDGSFLRQNTRFRELDIFEPAKRSKFVELMQLRKLFMRETVQNSHVFSATAAVGIKFQDLFRGLVLVEQKSLSNQRQYINKMELALQEACKLINTVKVIVPVLPLLMWLRMVKLDLLDADQVTHDENDTSDPINQIIELIGEDEKVFLESEKHLMNHLGAIQKSAKLMDDIVTRLANPLSEPMVVRLLDDSSSEEALTRGYRDVIF